MKTRSAPITLSESAIATLVAEHAQFRRFLVRRLGRETDADDILQQSLLRALQRGEGLRRGERVVAWFYRILRNALIDHFRHTKTSERQRERLTDELDALAAVEKTGADWEPAVCRCLKSLLPALNQRYAELIRRIDLDDEPRATVARDLKLSPSSLDVALHRARAALRRRLEIFCGSCSRTACLACGCRPAVE